jgi:[ribosomal protein S5]-alanine N-acetyltransferase
VISSKRTSEALLALHNSSAERVGHAPRTLDWRRRLPELSDGRVTLRELRGGDAPSLVAHLNDTRVCRYIAPCPSTTAEFRHFITWTQAERRRGALACYGVVPTGSTRPIGVIQVWRVERDWSTAEWGFAIGESFWGTGLFLSGARLMLDLAFSRLGVYRLEARSVDSNGRGNRVLEKLGAKREGVLRGGFQDAAGVRDQIMWSILAPEWQALRYRARYAN